MTHQWHISDNNELAAEAAANYLAQLVTQTLTCKSECHIVLPGGTTPKRCLEILAKKNLAWEKIHWYPGDERVLPLADKQRNDTMLKEVFWQHLPAGTFHTIPAELGTEQALTAYQKVVKSLQVIDIAFLGLGEDGHTASLFPNNPALASDADIVAVHESPKPPAERISFSLKKLREAEHKVVLAFGEAKADILLKIEQGADLPINKIGSINWFLDQSAAKLLTK